MSAPCGVEDDSGRANFAVRSPPPSVDIYTANTHTVTVAEFLLFVTSLASVPRQQVTGSARPLATPYP